MAELLTVGEFARLTHLTVKALHHYHDAGVLAPAVVDPATGYRYYRPEQVEPAHLIRRLRAVRMPLAQVRAVLASPDPAARDAGIAAHLDRLRAELAATSAAVASLQAMLRGGSAPQVRYRWAPAQECLALVDSVRRPDLARWCAQAFDRLYAAAGELGAEVAAPGGGLYETSWFATDAGTVTAFVPVEATAGRLPGGGVVRAGLAAGWLAVAVHAGSFDDLDRTYGALGRHVLERGTGAPGPIREHYLITPADTADADQLLTEVCWPVVGPAPDPPAPAGTRSTR